ncbi:Arylsulfatase [Pontiella desulfatans]|uniref:Arylsulfatase n=1 Tax=Pontiella desulfatans TaxID=2750659 RepID=A0A6C2U3H9_PONDE|nr:DUF1961 family protein [Pontiella desulfatans]SPS73927.1 sulfatase S1_32 [Kiritimatiellales bacterium]VGO14184.1 Arylsulfatase [Pontiella desulfatans]
MNRGLLLALGLMAVAANASEWTPVFADDGTGDWEQNWFLEGNKAWVTNGADGMTYSAGPVLKENASHAVLWTKRVFSGDVKIEYDYTRLDANLDAGVNILYIQATGLGTDEWPTDIFQSTEKRWEPWMKSYFLHMNALHVSYATDGRYVAARRYPAAELKKFQKETMFDPKYSDIDLFKPGETWHITAIKENGWLRFVAERNGERHEFKWELCQFPPVNEGRIGLRHMWTRCSRYQNFKVYEKARKPNVLTIILDDAGWKDLGYMGGDIATPAIDRYAKQGIRLNRFYTYSTCTPTRAAFFTGQAPSRSGIVYPIQHDDHYGIPAAADTLPEVFRRNGYKTALIGKWHLGVQPELAPRAHGFDYHYGLRGGWFDQYTRENPETGYDWWRNDGVAPKEEGHTTDLLTADAIRYLKGAGNDPFFLCLSYTAPHVPIQVDPKWAAPYEGKYETQTRVGYAGMMAQLDDSIGRVMETLEKRGLLENTLVVLFSDNGPSSPGKKWYIPDDFHETNFYGNDGVYGDVGPLRGWKAFPYDGGVRTPAFLYWKGRLQADAWDQPVIVQDLYPTILSLAGLEGASEGRDFLHAADPETFYWRTPKNLALRHGDWKLVVYNASPFEPDLKIELFDMEKDVSESNNLAQSHPEKTEELLALLKREFRKDATPHVNQKLLEREGK